MHLEYKIHNLKNLFNEVIADLDRITTDDFDEHFFRAKSNMILIHKLREELTAGYQSSDLKKNDEELLFLAKQIENKYDNIVKKFGEERNVLADNLRSVSNKKKIAQYSR